MIFALFVCGQHWWPLSRCGTNFHDRRHHGQHTSVLDDQSLSMAKVWHSKFMVEYGTKARRAWWKSCRRISFSFSFLHCIALRPDKILQSEAWRVHRVDFSSCLMFVISVLSAIMYRFFRRDALGRPKPCGRHASDNPPLSNFGLCRHQWALHYRCRRRSRVIFALPAHSCSIPPSALSSLDRRACFPCDIFQYSSAVLIESYTLVTSGMLNFS